MTDYASAGVDIGKGEEAVKRIKKHVQKTFTKDVLKGVGAFAGALDVTALKEMAHPVLLSSVDGVGTKTVIAEQLHKWENIGHDMVGHSGNDLVCQGARPLFFLDYIASSSLKPDVIETIVAGMAESCAELGCVLIGGETAEMPQVYAEGAHDVVGCIVGVADRDKMITGDTIEEGDVLIALPSNGLHTNGYSLARAIFSDMRENVEELGMTVGEALLLPHTSYVKTVLALHEEFVLKGVAHITGGGIPGNLPRILPKGLGARIEKQNVRILPIFRLMQEHGSVSDEAMYQACNMGVGMILVTEKTQADAIVHKTPGSYVLGEVVKGSGVELA
jgi:phosphoribosylformylglycinamidine cyclo-ligase